MTTLPENMFNDLLENAVTRLVKEKLELLLREEIKNFLEVEQEDQHNSRNGYYERTYETRHGKIDNLKVPRDRNGEFQTQLFEPYQRREGWLEEAIIHMYKGGMSTRDVAKFIESMYGTQYSPTTISNITQTVMEDIEAWQKRPLERRYSVIYLDGLYVKLKRNTVSSEAVYLAMGIDERGYRQILGFYVGGQESANGWRDVLKDIHSRGATDVLLGVFDGLPGLENAFKEIYPKADVQHCIVHKVRSTFPKIRVSDKTEFLEDLKAVYNATDGGVAKAIFSGIQAKWKKLYPREMKSWEDQLPTLLTFFDYPPLIWPAIYTSNAIERMNKEIRKRLRPMNSLTNIEAAEKIIYLQALDYNETWSRRAIRGFVDQETKDLLEKKYVERYPSLEVSVGE
ncbi:IS256 family transposase [Paenibacillus sp. CF384]|uniref:IS256 family transposase n=1 Tax=Paenibacillus sp. CF384 TaxID=1884382 RepID=UPI00089C70C8|nr:IS256 family transposase [Paenibacillus sp. CF384]SDY03537.1 Transposase (or an inactivated derivative) [Paenibacillus sp. CF384]